MTRRAHVLSLEIFGIFTRALFSYFEYALVTVWAVLAAGRLLRGVRPPKLSLGTFGIRECALVGGGGGAVGERRPHRRELTTLYTFCTLY